MGAQSHQAIYNQYLDPSTLVMTFTGVSTAPVVPVAPATGTYAVTLNFSITSNGLPYNDAKGLPSLLQKTFYAVQYNSATRQFLNLTPLAAKPSATPCPAANAVATQTAPIVCSSGAVPSGLNDGKYSITVQYVAYDPTSAAAPFDGAEVYGYIAKDLLNVESYTPATHYALYANMSSAAIAFGTAQAANGSAYASNADVTACEGCHGKPYRKHGYREAVVAGLPNFAACKTCHFDDRFGSDKGWQQEVNDPLGWATGAAIGPTDYAYTANVMNDTHMSHSMEFAYPLSMAECATCHTGAKLAAVTADQFFTAATCKSCHPVQDASAVAAPEARRAPSLVALWGGTTSTVYQVHQNLDLTGTANLNPTTGTGCRTCHDTGSGIAKSFATLHAGYDAPQGYSAAIYDANGKRYNAQYGAQIDSVTLTGTVMDIVAEPTFTAPGTSGVAATIVPTFSVSFYGWDTKDFIVSRHTADNRAPTAACPDFRGQPSGCTLEHTPGADTNPLFTDVARNDGKWETKVDLAMWTPPANTTGTIPAEIAAGTIKKAEVAVQPGLTIAGRDVALDVPSQTVDVTKTGVLPTWPDYFQGANAIVDEAKCNKCHDALGPTFHGGAYGNNIVVCRSCHVPTSGAFSLEMQSRSIDSFVHAIHSFQGFGEARLGSVDFSNPIEAKRYDVYINHTFPNFTTKNCEACHVTSTFTNPKAVPAYPVTYEVADQLITIPGLESAAASLSHGWYALDSNGNPLAAGNPLIPASRNIGVVPAYVVGPSSRACGGCHRARLINADDASGLASFNQHTSEGGYLVDTSKTTPNNSTNPASTYSGATAYVYGVIDKIMSFFAH